MERLRVTLDADGLGAAAIEQAKAAAHGLPIDFACVRVSDQALAGVTSAWTGGSPPCGEQDGAILEAILPAINGGHFPSLGDRGNLTPGQLLKVRDALILAGHVREGRNALVADDTRSFVGRWKAALRDELERRWRTEILTVDEFCVACDQMRESTEGLAATSSEEPDYQDQQ